MMFRLRWKKAGGHFHCRLFESVNGVTWAKNGDFVFDERSWPPAHDGFVRGGFEVLEEEAGQPVAEAEADEKSVFYWRKLGDGVKAESAQLQAIAKELELPVPTDRQGFTGPFTAFDIIRPLQQMKKRGYDVNVLAAAYGFTIGNDGEIHGLVAGDMGYEPTGMYLDYHSQRWLEQLDSSGTLSKDAWCGIRLELLSETDFKTAANVFGFMHPGYVDDGGYIVRLKPIGQPARDVKILEVGAEDEYADGDIHAGFLVHAVDDDGNLLPDEHDELFPYEAVETIGIY